MVDTMTPSIRRARFAMAGALPLLLLQVGPAWAHHGAPFGPDSPSPLVVGILTAVLIVTAGIAVVVIAMLLAKKTSRPE